MVRTNRLKIIDIECGTWKNEIFNNLLQFTCFSNSATFKFEVFTNNKKKQYLKKQNGYMMIHMLKLLW